MPPEINAESFIANLKTYQDPARLEEIKRNFRNSPGDEFLGVRMGQVFALAKEFMEMSLAEVEKLLESPFHEVRAGAVSIMDFQARSKKTSPEHKKALFDLYINRHDRINYWDLVDRAAPHVVGAYLWDKPRDILYTLAHSQNRWERRTAVVSTAYFIGRGDLEDTFKIAEILVQDDEEYVQLAVGGWVREAGKKNPQKLEDFLDRYAAVMPSTTLRLAIEKLGKDRRTHYLEMKGSGRANTPR